MEKDRNKLLKVVKKNDTIFTIEIDYRKENIESIAKEFKEQISQIKKDYQK